MRTHRMATATLVLLVLAATDYALAAGAIRGTRETITFEGLAGRKKVKEVPNGYDGFNWDNVAAAGKIAERGLEGFQAVLDGKDAAIFGSQHGSFSVPSGLFSLKSGHFAAAGNAQEQMTISAYKNGVLVGQLIQTLDPVNKFIRFDSTFQHIDAIYIQGTGDGLNVAMDDLKVTF